MKLKLEYTKQNIITGLLIYGIGDSVASLLTGDFLITRLLGMILIGGTVYAFEIPNFFKWINIKIPETDKSFKALLSRALLASAYFNPLWVTRHLFFLKVISLDTEGINSSLWGIGWDSFVGSIPISIVGNYVIQNKISNKRRFLSSCIFSAFMAVYYAMSELLFAN